MPLLVFCAAAKAAARAPAGGMGEANEISCAGARVGV